jgi:hypothetical protein
MAGDAPLRRISASAYEIPTDAPEADGTLEWDRTVLVVVEIDADTLASRNHFGYLCAGIRASRQTIGEPVHLRPDLNLTLDPAHRRSACLADQRGLAPIPIISNFSLNRP